MRSTYLFAVLLSGLLLSLAYAADDDKDKEKNAKKAKIPPLTFVGNYDGEVIYIDPNSDKMTVQITDVVPQWVANPNGGAVGASNLLRRMNQGQGGGSYVAKEEKKDIPINLSPDYKVRLMYAQPGGATTGTKKEKPPTAKELAEKDPDYKLGGVAGKKSQLSKGQIVRVSMGRNNDRINPQIYGMVVYVVKEGK